MHCTTGDVPLLLKLIGPTLSAEDCLEIRAVVAEKADVVCMAPRLRSWVNERRFENWQGEIIDLAALGPGHGVRSLGRDPVERLG